MPFAPISKATYNVIMIVMAFLPLAVMMLAVLKYWTLERDYDRALTALRSDPTNGVLERMVIDCAVKLQSSGKRNTVSEAYVFVASIRKTNEPFHTVAPQ